MLIESINVFESVSYLNQFATRLLRGGASKNL